MRFVVMVVSLAMASVLLGAALEKARHLSSFASSLRELGLNRAVTAAAAGAIALELIVSLAIVFRPHSSIAAGGVAVLAIAFAAAGIVAMRQPGSIRCHCFGAHGSGTLGKNQLYAFPFWLAGAALLWSQPPVPAGWRPAMFAAVGLTLAAVRGWSAVSEALRARGDRRSAKEMYAWLH
jgi:hypothetical protein